MLVKLTGERKLKEIEVHRHSIEVLKVWCTKIKMVCV
jgi:hypothetical protein